MFSLLLDIYVWVESLGYMVGLCIIFKKLSDCLPKWPHHFILPLAQLCGFLFLHSLVLVIVCLFSDSHHRECELYLLLVLVFWKIYFLTEFHKHLLRSSYEQGLR